MSRLRLVGSIAHDSQFCLEEPKPKRKPQRTILPNLKVTGSDRWFGGLVVWWFGGLVVWWFGGLVVWWFGSCFGSSLRPVVKPAQSPNPPKEQVLQREGLDAWWRQARRASESAGRESGAPSISPGFCGLTHGLLPDLKCLAGSPPSGSLAF